MNQSTCSNQTDQNYHLALARISTSAICLVLNLAILALVCGRQLFKSAAQRQFLYLVLSTEAYLLTLAAGVDIIFTRYSTHDSLCAALGFITQWASMTELFFTFSVIVFVHLAILRKHVRLAPHFCRVKLRALSGRQLAILEALFVVLGIASPAILDWLPFKDRRYGLAGAWCWIMSLDTVENCTDVGFVYQLGLNYIPTFFISLTAVVLTMVTNVVLCHAACKHAGTSNHHCKRAKEVALLLLCITLSSSLVIPEIVTRVLIKESNPANTPPYFVVMLYSVGTPLGRLVLSFDLLLYLYSFSIIGCGDEVLLHKCRTCRCCQNKYYHLDIEDGDVDYST